MLKQIAIVFGIILIVVGLLGYAPGITHEGHLFGVFAVNSAHNLIHILTGAAALISGLASERASRSFFQIFGVVYGLIAIMGFFYRDRPLFGVVAHNTADIWLHIVIAVVSLYLGFAPIRATHVEPGDAP